jgi:hypothetical protein
MTMPFLNWKESPIQQTVDSLDSGAIRWSIAIKKRELEDLIAGLGEILAGTANGASEEVSPAELRLSLPGDSAIFWKLSSSGSKLLMARPEVDRWVATLALEQGHMGRVLDRLKLLSEGQFLEVGKMGDQVLSVSNLEIIFSIWI